MAGTYLTNDFLAGAVGGCAGGACVHPFNTIKVLMQVQKNQDAAYTSFTLIKTIGHTLEHHGLRYFFRGISFPFLSIGLMNSVFFGAYGDVLQHLGSKNEESPIMRDCLIAGFVASVPTTLIACPKDVVLICIQTQAQHTVSPAGVKTPNLQFYSSSRKLVRDLVRKRGLRVFYRGFWSHLARDCPSNALFMAFYQRAVFDWHVHFPNVNESAIHFLTGGTAGVLSWLFVMPLDTVKSRVQADVLRNLYIGFIHCTKKTYWREGVRGFYRGALVGTLTAFPVHGVTLMVYNYVLNYLNNFRKGNSNSYILDILNHFRDVNVNIDCECPIPGENPCSQDDFTIPSNQCSHKNSRWKPSQE